MAPIGVKLLMPLPATHPAGRSAPPIPAPRPVDSDAILVGRSIAGDAAAFELLVRRHYTTVFAVALASLGERADAEDICHDTFVRAAAALGGCRDPERIKPWLCTIARNLSANRKSRGFAGRSTPLREEMAQRSEASPDSTGHDELAQHLLEELNKLSDIPREVVLLHDLDGCTHQEVATILGISEGASRQHLFRARQLLRSSHLLRLHLEDCHDR